MVVLNIFNMDDVQNENVIASLTNGTHIIGRGDLLNVKDKRVSRKHAVIEVSDENITLTSAHVNPCFFQAAQGKTLTIINKDHTNELGDGDRFGLLPDSLWFKVNINKQITSIDHINNGLEINNRLEPNEEPNTTADVTADQIEENVIVAAQPESNNLKRHGTDEPEEEHGSKKTRFNNDEEPTTSNNITNNHNNTDHHNETETNQKQTDLQPKDTDIPILTASPAESLNLQLDDDDMFSEGASQKEKNNSLNNISNGNIEASRGEASHGEDELNTSANLEVTAEMVDPYNEVPVGNVDAENAVTEIKQEDISISNSQQSSISQNAEVKQEPTASDDGTREVKTEPPDGDAQGSSSDNNTASGSGPKKTRRERCWYAERCFRKNPHHRESFSHPGDQDYNSDPEDDRPDCPYGASCYRRNIEHRQEYKHSNRPAPKPSNNPVNVQVNLQKGCPFCDHCNKKKSGGGGGGKSGYESDPYDDFDDEGIF